MNRSTTVAVALASLLTSIAPVSAQSPTAAPIQPAASPATQCLGDVRTLSGQMSKDGYWLDGVGYGYGYGYPIEGSGFGYGAERREGEVYGSARPGYEIRTLMASATILARLGQEQPCETVLAAAQTIYTGYITDLHDRGMLSADVPGWRQRQIVSAVSVTGAAASFRSDQLLDTSVVSPDNEPLGTVHDLVFSPRTGKIAYVIIARGGLFGIDASYVPVPWGAIKAAPNATLLVLDTTKAAMSAAPQVRHNAFSGAGGFDHESQTVDAYWTSRVKIVALNDAAAQ